MSVMVVSCQQQEPAALYAEHTMKTTATTAQPTNTLGNVLRSRQYVALPGQQAVAVSTDTDAAFEQQVAEYANGEAATSVPAAVQTPSESSAMIPATGIAAPQQTVATPFLTQQPAQQAFPMMQTGAADVHPAAGATVAGMLAGETQQTSATAMDYTVKITNGTPGRLFIEAQDAAGTIYPCGFMHQDRSYSTPMVQAEPIHGPITVVVRDPDQPDAPELRRYKVNPPPVNYAGKTIDIRVMPGGYYQASVDGMVYYTSPAPEGAPKVTPKPAAPAGEATEAPKPAESAPQTPAAA